MPNYSVPIFNLRCNVWNTLDGLVPNGPALYQNQPCSTRTPRAREQPILQYWWQSEPITLVIAFPPGLTLPDAWGFRISPTSPLGVLIELLADPGVYYYCLQTEIAARGFPNEHINCWVERVSPRPPS